MRDRRALYRRDEGCSSMNYRDAHGLQFCQQREAPSACFKCTSRGCCYRKARARIHLKETEFAAVAASRFHRRLNTRRNIGTVPIRVLDQRSAHHSFMVGKMQMKWGQFSEIYTERSSVGRANVCASFWSREITRIRPRTEHRVTTRGRCLAQHPRVHPPPGVIELNLLRRAQRIGGVLIDREAGRA